MVCNNICYRYIYTHRRFSEFLNDLILFVFSMIFKSYIYFKRIYSIMAEKAMAPHSSTLAWKIPWTEEPDGLQSTGSLRVGQDSTTSLSLFTFMHWRWKWQPTPVFSPGESQGRGAWWAAIYGVAQSWTRLKQLSSSRSSSIVSWKHSNMHMFLKKGNKKIFSYMKRLNNDITFIN